MKTSGSKSPFLSPFLRLAGLPRPILLAALAALQLACMARVGAHGGGPDGGGAAGDGAAGGAGEHDALPPRPDLGVPAAGGAGGGGGPQARREICDNGLDDDGDGMVDDGCFCALGTTERCFPFGAGLADVGACAAGVAACEPGDEIDTWGACQGALGPLAETCNGVDDDCDGAVDEDCACLASERRSCYAGPAATAGVGACRAGTETCVIEGGVARFADCTGAVLPAAETCNGADDDCNGVTDDGLTRSCGSGTGDCRSGMQTCAAGTWSACVGGVGPTAEDCNGGDENCDGTVDEGCSCVDGTRIACGRDTGACVAGTQLCAGGRYGACTGAVGPVAETCNGADDDCDGVVDNGCLCASGDSRPCYAGPAASAGVGTCRAGTQRCVIAGGVASWGACAGQVLPAVEACNALDDDCDGAADDGLTRACGSAVGDCRPGTQTCAAGAWGACGGGVVGPAAEDCNGGDENCDGTVDEGCSCLDGTRIACGTDTGACVAGTQTCVGGRFTACAGAVGPVAETCNDVDDDCDSVVDDGCACRRGDSRACYDGPAGTAGVGACRAGSQGCVVDAGVARWGVCAGAVLPGAESCNGSDDDCDGQVDDGVTRACGSSVGDCRPGTQTCAAGVFGACAGGVGATAEDCNGGDENCNGVVDEGCSCLDGTRIACGTDTGACVAGTQTCAGGRFGSCTGAVGPVLETCNGADDDCDGIVDNGCACQRGETRPCYDGAAGTAGVGSCRSGTQACVIAAGQASWGACAGQVLPAPETCNGADDDCDGHVDGLTRACGSGVGECRMGAQTCVAGVFGACTGGVAPAVEDCNGGDEDCDGVVDDGCQCLDGARIACGTDTGACVAGTQTCAGGRFGACVGAVGPVLETCNDADDDCNGVIDDGCACRRGQTRACYDGPAATAGVGICRAGAQACVIEAGVARWGLCAGAVLPGAESCNALDDDCDGAVDEGVTRSCGSSVGDCRPGTQTCAAGVFGACAGAVAPAVEDCNGGDENCNGVVDEGCTCLDGTRIACGTDTGVCVAGTQVCAGGNFGSCTGAVGPVAETCNALDDDCDGTADEGFACVRGASQACQTACDQPGTRTCGATCTFGPCLAPEVCNGCDDDGDGAADDGFACARGAVQACSTSCQTAGRRTCNPSCSGFSACTAAAETCGNRCDDDGDGAAEEGCCAAGAWTLTVLDSAGHHHPDMALDGAGGVHVVYGDTPSVATYRHLLATGTQQVEVIDQSIGTTPVMALDAAGVVHAAFSDSRTAAQPLRYARHTGANTWTSEVASTASGDKAMVVDAAGIVHIVFAQRGMIPSPLHHLQRAAAGGWTDRILAADAGPGVGLTLDGAGLVHLVFVDLGTRELRHGVRSAAGAWSFDTIETGVNEAVFDASIKTDGRGRVHVAAIRAVITFNSTGRFRYYVRDGAAWSAGEDIATGAWTTGLSDPSGGVPGLGSSLAVDAAGTPYVAYYLVGSGDLRFAYRPESGVWQSELIESSAGPLDGLTGSIRAAIAVDANLVVRVVYSRYDESQLIHGLRRCR